MQIKSELLDKLRKNTAEEERILSGGELDRGIYSEEGDFVISDVLLPEGGKPISIRPHTRYVAFPTHKHSYLEMLIVLTGSITHIIDGRTIVQQSGEIMLLNKHASHALLPAGEKDVGVNVIMSDSFVSSVSRDLMGTVFAELVKENVAGGRGAFLHFATAGRKQIENLIENLLIELAEGSASLPIAERTVSLLLYCLSEGADELLLDGGGAQSAADGRMDLVINYIKADYRTASLSELSGRLFITAPYLSKLIKESLGKSFSELVLEERIKRAKELLLSSTMPIGEVIRSVGYENESYFHREFRSRVGTTPLAYRKNEALEKAARRLDKRR